jgi:hypothetical protein
MTSLRSYAAPATTEFIRVCTCFLSFVSSAMCFFRAAISTSFCLLAATSATSLSLSFMISPSADTSRSGSRLRSTYLLLSTISTEKLLWLSVLREYPGVMLFMISFFRCVSHTLTCFICDHRSLSLSLISSLYSSPDSKPTDDRFLRGCCITAVVSLLL